jgi:hypothetical protein
MSDCSDNEIRTIWAVLSTTLRKPAEWDDADVREAALDVWRIGLRGLTPQVAKVAAVAYAAAPDRSGGYAGPAAWPSPDQVAARAIRIVSTATGTRLIDPPDAWAHMTGLIRARGSYSPPKMGEQATEQTEEVIRREVVKRNADGSESRAVREYRSSVPWWRLHDDPAQRAALESALDAIGGWVSHCLCPDEQVASNRARFIAAYEAHVRRGREEVHDRNIVAALEQRHGPMLGGPTTKRIGGG